METNDKKTIIVKAAMECFVASGFADTKLSDIAKKAKLPAPLIHYYFKDSPDLQYHVILHVAERLKNFSIENMRKATGNPKKAIEEYLRTPFKWAEAYPEDLAVWLFFYSVAGTDKKYKELLSGLLLTGHERIRLLIYQLLDDGEYYVLKGTTVNELAQHIQTWITGLLVRYGTEKHGKRASAFSDQLIELTFKFLQA